MYESFHDRLCRFGHSSYEQYLGSDAWKCFKINYTRHQALSGLSPRCFVCSCGHKKKQKLNLHHIIYDNVCEEDYEDVVWLCREHHVEVHGYEKKNDCLLCKAHILLKESGLYSKRKTKPKVSRNLKAEKSNCVTFPARLSKKEKKKQREKKKKQKEMVKKRRLRQKYNSAKAKWSKDQIDRISRELRNQFPSALDEYNF